MTASPSPRFVVVRRYAECTAFVLLWMACEVYFRLTPLQAQFLGIPLIIAFQLAIARRPLAQLWARDAESFRFDWRTCLVAIAIVVEAGLLLWLGSGRNVAGLPTTRWPLFGIVVVGAIPAAFALREQAGPAFRRALPIVLAAAAFRFVWHAAWFEQGGAILFPAGKVVDFLTLFVCEFAALFVVDEVAFRGALDPYLGAASSGRLNQGFSAVYLSVLWAVWHLPAYHPKARSLFGLFGELNLFSVSQIVLGILLTFAARRSRTLVPGAAVHALHNAYVLALVRWS